MELVIGDARESADFIKLELDRNELYSASLSSIAFHEHDAFSFEALSVRHNSPALDFPCRWHFSKRSRVSVYHSYWTTFVSARASHYYS